MTKTEAKTKTKKTPLIEFHLLTPEFYAENQLVQMQDKGQNKGRGYGVLLAEVKGYKFAIPLRSTIKIGSQFCFPTRQVNATDQHGLDYTKAVIITDEDRYVLSRHFQLREKSDYVAIRKKERTIISEFESFVEQYIQAVKNDDQSFLALREIKLSTLQNYHNVLCE